MRRTRVRSYALTVVLLEVWSIHARQQDQPVFGLSIVFFFFDQFFFSCCLIVLRSFSFLVLVIWFMVSNLWMLDDFSDLASILLRDLGILARILASCERVTRISTFQV